MDPPKEGSLHYLPVTSFHFLKTEGGTISHHSENNTSVQSNGNHTNGCGIMVEELTENLLISTGFNNRIFPFRNTRGQ